MSVEIKPGGLQGSLESLLQPISQDAPCGMSIRYEAEYDLLREAKREDDTSLPTGIWQAEVKRGDWATVEKLGRQILQSRSKDLTVAVWLGEAWMHRRGIEGLSAAMSLLLGLCQRFWDTVHPLPQDGDMSYRTGPLAWGVHAYSTLLLSRMPLPVLDQRSDLDGFTLADWRVWQKHLGLDQGKNTSKTAAPLVEAAKKLEQKINDSIRAADVIQLRNAHSFALNGLTQITELAQECDQKMGNDAPTFQPLFLLMQELEIILKEWLTMHPQPLPTVPDLVLPAPVAERKPDPLPFLQPNSREEAYRQLQLIADYLARTEPHSPVPYLIYRSVEWGNKPLRDLLAELISSDAEARRLWSLLGVLP
jgi:type VI secretion system protein ImpA